MPEISRLHYITQDGLPQSHLEQVKMAVESGLDWIQLRIKNQPAKKVEELLKKALEITKPAGVSLILNDYYEIAFKWGAQGVHLGQTDASIDEVKKKAPKNFIIGGTCNTLEQLREVYNMGADYAGLGPFRYTSTKKNLSPVLGLKGVSQILQQNTAIPVVVIGGLDVYDLKDLADVGAYGIALSSTINVSENPSIKIAEIQKEMHRQWPEYEMETTG